MRSRLHALDGLRAIAALLVVIHHLVGIGSSPGTLAILFQSATASGVALFFLLSGTVLGPPYIRHDRPLLVSEYFRRRVQRLWPPYIFAWLLAGLTIAITTAWPTWWTKSAYLPRFDRSDWMGQLAIVNWWSTPYSFAWWSLTVEIAFYAILPLLVPIFRANRDRPKFMLIVYCGSLIVSMLAYDRVQVPVVQHLVNYASCFTGGLVLASRALPAWQIRSALLAGAPIVLASVISPTVNPHVGWGLIYLAVTAFALDTLSPLSRGLSSSLLVWLGERSYSLFLTHHTVIVLTFWSMSMLVGGKGPIYYVGSRATSIALSLLVAMALFSLVERRFASGLVTSYQFWPPLPLRRFWRAATRPQG